MKDIKLTLEIDGVKYGASLSTNSDNTGIHYDFNKIIYDTLEYHFAASRQEVLPMIGVQERITMRDVAVVRSPDSSGIYVPGSR